MLYLIWTYTCTSTTIPRTRYTSIPHTSTTTSESPTSKSDVYAPVPPELQAEIERYQSRLYNITEVRYDARIRRQQAINQRCAEFRKASGPILRRAERIIAGLPAEEGQASGQAQNIAVDQAPSIVSDEASSIMSDQAPSVVSDQAPSIASGLAIAPKQASSTVAREIQTTYHGVSALVHNEALAEIRKLREGLRQAEAREDALKADNEALKADNEALKAENETLTTELCESEEACQALDIRWMTLENERRIAARRQGPSKAQTELEGANKTLLDKLSKYQTALDQSNNSVETLLDEADKQSDRIAELKKIIEQYKAMVE
ncbi:hypothetical protein HBI83_054670 [Parastagonospora nodorum]|nr:hypothetical protein HBI83_054670 [Parastagonospora nodorum]